MAAISVCFVFLEIFTSICVLSLSEGLYGKFEQTRDKVESEISEVIDSVKSFGKAQLKNYTGKGFTEDMDLKAYYHDQTVLVAGYKQDELMDCEIFERYEAEDKRQLLSYLFGIGVEDKGDNGFKNMMHLMKICQKIEETRYTKENAPEEENSEENEHNEGFIQRIEGDVGRLKNPLDTIRIVATGTKWCGPGDSAVDYFDLGKDKKLDRCCRTHDLCPSKINAKSDKYNITNPHTYTMSHCECDARLKNCFDEVNTRKSLLLKKIFFNLVKVKCVDGVPESTMIRENASAADA